MGSGVRGCCLLCFELTWSLAQTQCKQAGEIDSSICPGFDMQWICKYVRTYIIIDYIYIYHYINSHITSCNIINDIVRDILTTCTSSTNKLRGNQLGSFSYIKFRKYMSSSFWGVGPQVVRSEIPRFLRNFLLWSLQPGEHLKHAFAYQEGDQDPAKKAGLFPYVVHGCWLLIHASLICLPLGEEGQLSCDSFLQLGFFWLPSILEPAMMSSLPSQSFRCFRSSWFFWRVLFWSCSLHDWTLNLEAFWPCLHFCPCKPPHGTGRYSKLDCAGTTHHQQKLCFQDGSLDGHFSHLRLWNCHWATKNWQRIPEIHGNNAKNQAFSWLSVKKEGHI